MAVPRRLRENAALPAEDLDEDDDEDFDDDEAFRGLLLDAIDNDPEVRAAIRRLIPAQPAAKPKPIPRGGRRG